MGMTHTSWRMTRNGGLALAQPLARALALAQVQVQVRQVQIQIQVQVQIQIQSQSQSPSQSLERVSMHAVTSNSNSHVVVTHRTCVSIATGRPQKNVLSNTVTAILKGDVKLGTTMSHARRCGQTLQTVKNAFRKRHMSNTCWSVILRRRSTSS